MTQYKRRLLQGNEACAEGAIAAGMRFFAGYPITPSTEIAERCALRLPQVGGCFLQMEDEIASISAVIGASIAGKKAMTATSGPGFSLKQESIGYACMAEIPIVIVDVQRAGPSTGLPTSPSQGDVMQTRWGCHGDHPILVLSPGSVQECYELTVRAFNLAEAYRCPVILLMDEIIAHLREGLLIPDEIVTVERSCRYDREAYAVSDGELVPSFPPVGKGLRYNITGLVHGADGVPSNDKATADKLCRRLLDKIERNRGALCDYESVMTEDAETVILCFGGTRGAALEAAELLRAEGVKAGMMRLRTIWPFPDEAVSLLAERVSSITVVEHNDGQILQEVMRAAAGKCSVTHIGKVNGTIIRPDEIIKHVRTGKDAK